MLNAGYYVLGKLNLVESRFSEKNSKTYVTAFIEVDNSEKYGSSVQNVGMEIPDGSTAESFAKALEQHKGKQLFVKARISKSDYGLNVYAGVVTPLPQVKA